MAEFAEQFPGADGGAAEIVEGDAGGRIEVDPQLVGDRQIVHVIGPDVETQAALVDRPQDMREIVGDQRVAGGAVGGGDLHRVQPVRRRFRHPLLEPRLARRAVRIAFEQQRAVAHDAEKRFGDRLVVADQIQLRLTAFGEVDLVRIADRDGSAVDLDIDRLAHPVDASSKMVLNSAGATSSSWA